MASMLMKRSFSELDGCEYFDAFAGNSLVHMYVKCGRIENACMEY
jgi:hypothetical protein